MLREVLCHPDGPNRPVTLTRVIRSGPNVNMSCRH